MATITSNSVTIDVSPASTTAPGYNLPPSKWTGQGTYGSNTNPVLFGNWAVESGGVWGVNWYGSGYYENPSGTQEMYFGSTSDAINWLNENGFPTQEPIASGFSINASVSGMTVTLQVEMTGSKMSTLVVEWGDGSVSSPNTAGATSLTLTHTYTTGGTYTITASATDQAYTQHTATTTVTISQPKQSATIQASYDSSNYNLSVYGTGFGSSDLVDIVANGSVIDSVHSGPSNGNPTGVFDITVGFNPSYLQSIAPNGVLIVYAVDVTSGAVSNTVTLNV